MLFVVLLLAALIPSLSFAQLKIGFVNTAKILAEAPQAEQANKRLQQEFAPREKALADAQKSLRQIEQKLAKDGDVMSDAQRRQLERDIIAQRRDLKRSMDEFREDVNLRRNEELGKFQKEIFEVIDALAKEEKYDLIVNDGAVIFASDKIDVTSQVLKRLATRR